MRVTIQHNGQSTDYPSPEEAVLALLRRCDVRFLGRLKLHEIGRIQCEMRGQAGRVEVSPGTNGKH